MLQQLHIKFIRNADRIFDFCNSRNPLSRGFKALLKPINEHLWRSPILEILNYWEKLTNMQNIPLWKTKNKTPIKGFIITVKSIINVYEKCVKANGPLKYILTYKFSQAHLESFCGSVR